MHTSATSTPAPSLAPSRTTASNWHAQLRMDYKRQDARTVVHHQHQGPLRILQSLYPEGDAVCHNVLVHPPGGLVGGDTLEIKVHAEAGAHGLITTPGATRFYRSEGPLALQRSRIDYAAFSGHKLYAPKGIGMLYVRRGAPFTPLLAGGGQEGGMRSGTENMPGIAALGAVLDAILTKSTHEYTR